MSLPFRIVISATFTAEPLEAILLFWGKQLGVDFEIRFAPFGQVAQTLLDAAGEFAANRHGVNVALVRASDLGERARENAAQLVEGLHTASGRDGVPLIFGLCPSEGDWAEAESWLSAKNLRYRDVERLYPVPERFDHSADRLGAIPYTEKYFVAWGTALARRIVSVTMTPYKVIAVDCDNTLWDGICGEDGPAGVTLNEGRRVLQEFLSRQRAEGMLLVLASKNNWEDVEETFAGHEEMPLRVGDFSAQRVNWEAKPENLAAMARELGLGVDSFLFLDDSAKECAEMREEQPRVLTLELPEALLGDAEKTRRFLEHVWAFDRAEVTEEDRKRAEAYAQARDFGQAFGSAHSLEEFMASLDLRVDVKRAVESELARVAQLTQRTNQFNFTTIRRNEAELRALLATRECLTAKVADRFGDHGLTGAVLFWIEDEALRLDSFLLSCRVLGRGVEHRMMEHLGKIALERGVKFVDVELRRTSKNEPARRFLASIGEGLAVAGNESHLKFRFAAEYLSGLKWKAPSVEMETSVESAPEREEHRFLPFERIARELSTVEDIVTAMGGGSVTMDAGLTGTERELAAIWAELLKVKHLGPEDKFFDLGGHSLLAVLLISKVRERLGVTLPVDEVYSGDLTLRDLAMKVDALGAGGMEAAEYEAMLAEIEALSDEDVKALLGQE